MHGRILELMTPPFFFSFFGLSFWDKSHHIYLEIIKDNDSTKTIVGMGSVLSFLDMALLFYTVICDEAAVL